MLRPLLIDSNYCIVNNAVGQISRTFWEHIDRNKFLPIIVCGTEKHKLNLKNEILQVEDRNWIRKGLRLLEKIGIPDLCYIPDTAWYSWCPLAFNRIIKRAEIKYDYIHSVSNPRSNHLLARKIKEKLGIPWIAQFYDPWHDTSGRKYNVSFFNKLDLKYEREVAENADILIHSNEVIKDIWIDRYGKEIANKIVILPFNFNIYDLPQVKPIRLNSKLEISHIGHIYNTRSAMTVFEALRKLSTKDPDIAKKLHFSFIGGIHKEEKQFVIDNGLADFVSFIPTLPPEELEAYYQNSNMFLIIDLNINKSPNYPSKLMMYFYYQRPIIGITNPNCQLVKELKQTNNTCIYYNESEKLAYMLKDAVLNYGKYLIHDRDYWKRHTVESVQKMYEDLLKNRLSIGI